MGRLFSKHRTVNRKRWPVHSTIDVGCFFDDRVTMAVEKNLKQTATASFHGSSTNSGDLNAKFRLFNMGGRLTPHGILTVSLSTNRNCFDPRNSDRFHKRGSSPFERAVGLKKLRVAECTSAGPTGRTKPGFSQEPW